MALTPQQVRDAADTKLAQLWTTVQARQATYAGNHAGKFFQGLLTHSVVPADGASTLPDVGSRTPTDQAFAWPAALINSVLPFALEMTCYDGPAGTGYQATVYVTIAGQTWTRTAQVGPEGWRAAGWAVVSGTP